MRNNLLSPVSSQLYNIGSNEVQAPNMDFPMSMDGKINVDHGGDSLYMDPINLIDDVHQQGHGEVGFSYQPLINYAPVIQYESMSSEFNQTTPQKSMINPLIEMSSFVLESSVVGSTEWAILMLAKRKFIGRKDFQSRQMRKRTTCEVNYQSPHVGVSDLNGNASELGEWEKNKRKKGNSSSAEQCLLQKRKVPARRSQKLSDRITALQKLVSPYGKTDTAAVLQEAVPYIKLLQEQIQEIRGNTADLRSKGLCLVPVSLTENLALHEDLVDPNAYLSKYHSSQ